MTLNPGPSNLGGKPDASIEAATIAHPSVAHTGNVAQKKQRTYQPKVCACGSTFTPTGPRDVRCPACKAGR
jgi:hypothetical protein